MSEGTVKVDLPPMTMEDARLMMVTEAGKSARRFLEFMTLGRLHFAEYPVRTVSGEIGAMSLGVNAEALEDVGLQIVGYTKLPIGKTPDDQYIFEVGFLVKRPRLVGL